MKMPRTSLLQRLLFIAMLSLTFCLNQSPADAAAPEKLAKANAKVGEESVGQSAQVFKVNVGGKAVQRDYLLYLPKTYHKAKDKKWPLLIFLHGSGERGDDVNRVKVHGPPKLVANGKDMEFVIVSPQCPRGTWWNPEVQIALYDQIIKTHRIDADRVYLTGLSMGGYGTWSIACKYPDRFAAAVPICGGGNPKDAAKMKNIPTWVFHGDKDRAVNVQKSKDMVEALKAAGGNVQLTIYPGVGHDSWTRSYDNPKLYAWLLSHKRNAKSP